MTLEKTYTFYARGDKIHPYTFKWAETRCRMTKEIHNRQF